MHISLETMTSYTRRCKGDIPPPLVGATTTYVSLTTASSDKCKDKDKEQRQGQDRIYVFGGRRVGSRQVVASMYVLDLASLVWRRIDPHDDDDSESGAAAAASSLHWPQARYFHTVDAIDGKLVLFGGMGHRPSSSGDVDATVGGAVDGGSSTPCVLYDVHVFDCETGQWSDGCKADASLPRPMARYAHLSAVSRGKIYVMGGQDIRNEYITETAAYDIARREWVGTWISADPPRGSYRSVAVTSRYGLSSVDRPGPRMATVEQGGGKDVYLFSNSNFTDVRRELQLLTPAESGGNGALVARDITAQMRGATLPPGLRFPFGTILGHHLVLAGTYLSASVQTFAIWALDLRTFVWRRLDALALDGPGQPVERGDGRPGGSWNKAVCWEDRNRLVVFGDKHSDLQQDYEHRAINFNHVVIVELEIFGIYRIPHQPAVSPAFQDQLLRTLASGKVADFALVCDDGRKIPCSRKILEQRWPWFRREIVNFTQRALAIVEDARQTSAKDGEVVSPEALPITLSATQLTPSTLHFSEPYPICLAFLQFLYTRQIITPLQNQPPVLCGLLAIAKQYDLPDLEEAVVHVMHEKLADETALGIYEIATLCGCTSLQIRALRMVLLLQKKPKRSTNGHGRRGSEVSLLTTADAQQQTPSTGKTTASTPGAMPRSAQDHGHANGQAGRQTAATTTNKPIEPSIDHALTEGNNSMLAPIMESKATKRRSWRNSLREAVFSSALRDSGMSSRPIPTTHEHADHDDHRPHKLVRASKSLHDISVAPPIKDVAPPLPFPSSNVQQLSPDRNDMIDRQRSDSLKAIHHFVLNDSPPRPSPAAAATKSNDLVLHSPSLLSNVDEDGQGGTSPLLSTTGGRSSRSTFAGIPETPQTADDLGWSSPVIQTSERSFGGGGGEPPFERDLSGGKPAVRVDVFPEPSAMLAEWSEATSRIRRDKAAQARENVDPVNRQLRIDTDKAKGNNLQGSLATKENIILSLNGTSPSSPRTSKYSSSSRSSAGSELSNRSRGAATAADDNLTLAGGGGNNMHLDPGWTPHVNTVTVRKQQYQHQQRQQHVRKSTKRTSVIIDDFGVVDINSSHNVDQTIKPSSSSPSPHHHHGLSKTLRRLWA